MGGSSSVLVYIYVGGDTCLVAGRIWTVNHLNLLGLWQGVISTLMLGSNDTPLFMSSWVRTLALGVRSHSSNGTKLIVILVGISITVSNLVV